MKYKIILISLLLAYLLAGCNTEKPGGIPRTNKTYALIYEPAYRQRIARLEYTLSYIKLPHTLHSVSNDGFGLLPDL